MCALPAICARPRPNEYYTHRLPVWLHRLRIKPMCWSVSAGNRGRASLFSDAAPLPSSRILALNTIILALSFAIILVGSELFTNGVEWAGHRLHLAEAAVGSILAAVGTALPETFIPAVALLTSRNSGGARTAVGLGAIVGAPLMLSTVALFVMGIAAIAFRRRRGRIALKVVRDDARRDLAFFFPVFLLLVIAGTIPMSPVVRHVLAVGLLIVYASYTVVMLRLKRAAGAKVGHGLYFESWFRGKPLEPRGWAIAAQVIAGVLAILLGAVEFADQI